MQPAIRPTWRLGQPSLVLLAALTLAPRLAGQTPPSAAAAASPLDHALRATVSIETSGSDGQSTGSGVIVSGGGIVATAAHVLRGASQASVRLATGESYDVVGVVDYDERLDVALLAIAGFDLPTAEMGNADSLQVGQRIIAIGSPLGLEATVTDGILSAVRLDGGVKRLQISTPVAPGSSGGPLLTERGQVVGLVVSGIRGNGAENLNFALPINYVRGKLAFVTSKAPTPLAEVKYGVGPNSTVSTATATSGAGVSSLGRVNEGLSLDFAVLDGAQAYYQDKGQGQLRIKNVVWYAVSRDPTGTAILERGSSVTYRNQGLVAGVDLATETGRVIYHIGPTNRFSTESVRISQAPNWPSGRTELSASGSQYTYQSSGMSPRTGSAPPGVFPSDMIGAVIAALPKTLLPKTSFWILDPSADRVQEVAIEVVGNGRLKLPAAVAGQSCREGAQTSPVEFDVVRLRRRVGVTDEMTMVLAQRPHLLVDQQGTKCLRLPGLTPPAPPSTDGAPRTLQ
jgi:S1-C subfamily serine protease